VTAASRPDWFGDHTTAARSSRVPSGPVVGAVVAGLAVFLAITVTAGLLIWDDAPTGAVDQGARSLGGTDPNSSERAPVAQLEQSTQTARIGSATLVLPGDPYHVHPDPLTLQGVFDVYFWAAATVHPRYDGRRHWSSTMLMGRLTSGASTGDLESDGRFVLDQHSRAYFDGHPVKVRQLSGADHAVDGHPGMLFTAAVHYAVPNLPSRYDTVSALLVRLDDGSVLVAATSVPDDADPALARQAADALRSLSIR
jgi:hypothetical protein